MSVLPLGTSSVQLVTATVSPLHMTSGRYLLCTLCIGMGRRIALFVERV